MRGYQGHASGPATHLLSPGPCKSPPCKEASSSDLGWEKRVVGTLPSGCLPRPETGAQVPMAIPVRRMTLYKGFAVVCARLRRGRSEAEMYPEAPYLP